ncbi:hypothetical protein P879_02223 [Paragonimus westermani]|uniref:Uncharacterized protein n=1 Tax=Paragonimus westermani TaxID=34504 RepID=A0A8T0DKA7_9TREM|nr:hypothetical protein P879_02223 [Paragonimus westermani]
MLLILTASILFLILFFTCSDKARLLMILVVAFTAGALLSLAIATGLAFHPFTPGFGAWLLAAVWTCILALLMAVLYLVYGDSPI